MRTDGRSVGGRRRQGNDPRCSSQARNCSRGSAEYSLFIYAEGRSLRYLLSHGGHEVDRDPDGAPGPTLEGDHRAQGARDRGSPLARPSDRHRRGPGRDAHRRRRQHVHRLHRRRRLPQRRPLPPAHRRGGAGAALALLAHRLHDRSLRGLRRARRAADRGGADLRPRQGGVLQRGHRGGRELDQVRPLLHEAAGRDRLRGRLPRAHDALDDDDVEVASVQGGARSRSRRRSTASRIRTSTAGSMSSRPSRRFGGRSSPRSPPRAWLRS